MTAAVTKTGNSISRPCLRWLLYGSSTYCVYACVAGFIAALIASLNWNRNKRARLQRGFTLIELMIVMTIIGILAAIAVPNYQWALLKARETVLQENLYGIRSAIDHYMADLAKYPDKLEDLVDKKYLHDIPADPFTRKRDTWVTVPPPVEQPPEASGSVPQSTGVITLPKGNVYDVKSGSDLVGINGIPYREW